MANRARDALRVPARYTAMEKARASPWMSRARRRISQVANDDIRSNGRPLSGPPVRKRSV